MIRALRHCTKLYMLLLFVCAFLGQTIAQQNAFRRADSLKEAKNYTAFEQELQKVKLKAFAELDTSIILKAHFHLLQNYHFFTKNKDSVAIYYDRGIELADRFENAYFKANYRFIWADHQVSLGNYTEGLALFQELEPIVESNDYDFLPFFYDGYARLLYYLKEYASAFEMLKKEASIFEARDKPANRSAVYNNLGILYKSRRNRDSSLHYHEKSLAISQAQKDTLAIIQSYNNIGQTYEILNELGQTAYYYEKAYELAPEMATESLITNYSNILISRGEYAKAERLLTSVLSSSINKLNQKVALERLVALFKIQKKYERALAYQEKLKSVSEELLDETKVKELERLKVSYEMEKKEREITGLQEKNTAQQTIIRQNKVLVFVVLVVLVLVVLIFILYLRNKLTSNYANKVMLQQRLLRSQMDPHFIFNALSNIQTDILKKENDKAVKYLVKFAKLLRHTLENSNLNSIVLSDELSATKDYLELQKLRLSQQLNYTISVDETIEEDLIKVPSMLLQPIIENSIEHGVEHVEMAKIEIILRDFDSYILCEISDNGVGYSQSSGKQNPTKNSLSTNIIRERLDILSQKAKQKYTYTIEDRIEHGAVVGAKATIMLPILN